MESVDVSFFMKERRLTWCALKIRLHLIEFHIYFLTEFDKFVLTEWSIVDLFLGFYQNLPFWVTPMCKKANTIQQLNPTKAMGDSYLAQLERYKQSWYPDHPVRKP